MQAIVSIEDVYNVTGVGAIPVGNVKSGTLKIGMKLNINGKIMSVESIEMNHQKVQEANEGNKIGFSLSGGDYNTLKSIGRRDVAFSDDASVMIRTIEPPAIEKPRGNLLKAFLIAAGVVVAIVILFWITSR